MVAGNYRNRISERLLPDYHIPVVDIFAGPGGLGEGFSSYRDEKGKSVFRNVLSIENEKYAHSTLVLRHFYRSFQNEEIPDDYFRYLKSQISFDELFAKFEVRFRDAQTTAFKLTLRENNHKKIKQRIKSSLKNRKNWVLVGGPPCQAYSLVGRARMHGSAHFEKDKRHFLYKEYLKIITDHWPPVFLMENVKGLLSTKLSNEPIVNQIIADLSDPLKSLKKKTEGKKYLLFSLTEPGQILEGDNPRRFLVRAEKFGIPQARHRIFILGVREDIPIKPKQLKYRNSPTVEQTIGNLPLLRSGLSRRKDSAELWRRAIFAFKSEKINNYQHSSRFFDILMTEIENLFGDDANHPKFRQSQVYPALSDSKHATLNFVFDKRFPLLTAHETRGHMQSDLHRYFYCSMFAKSKGRSPKLVDFPEILYPNHRNLSQALKNNLFSDRFRVQLRDKLANTITSHISKDGHSFIHYDPAQCRSLTVREAARLQTFPDNYHFQGPRTSQYHQVGNAVPPFLAHQIAEVIAGIFFAM